MPLQDWSETTLIAQMLDEPLFSDDIDALLRRIEAAGADVPDVIVDLRAVSRLNSSNLTQLLKLRKALQARHRRLRICSVRDTVWSIFLVTRLDQLFEFTDDVTTSLTSLQIEG